MTTVTPVADVAIGKTGPALVVAGSNLVYTISIDQLWAFQRQQRGGHRPLPANVTFVSATGGGLNNSGVVNWSLGTLTNGQTTQCHRTVTAPASGSSDQYRHREHAHR